MNPQEIVRVQTYLRKVFGTKTLSVRARAKKDDSAEIFVGDEFIGILFREEEEGELSYQFQMAILEIDLEEYAATRRSRSAPELAVRLLFDGADARWAARDLDLAGYLQCLAVKAQHVERLVEHGLRQQRLAVPAPDYSLTPASHLRLCGERQLASLDAVDHDDAMIVVGLV